MSITRKATLMAFIMLAINGCSKNSHEKEITGYKTEIAFIRDNGFLNINSYTKAGYQIVSSRRTWQESGVPNQKEWGTEYTLQKPIYSSRNE